MPSVPDEHHEDERASVKGSEILSFKATGRLIALEDVDAEFRVMQAQLKSKLTAEVAFRVCTKSGTHLIKLVSPRVDGGHAVLRFTSPQSNQQALFLPSTNAPDIPFCKLLYRPLEILGHESCSVIAHILNPQEHSEHVLQAFASVFGVDVLDAVRRALLGAPPVPLELGAGEFPIIFIPRPGGGDVQVTPVSPASAFMDMKQVAEPYFRKAQPDAPRPARGRWTRQAVSAKPQNISGAIGGPRLRFLATMPPGMTQGEAELFRYVHGGAFPRWRDSDVSNGILRYAERLEADAAYNNADTRAALDRTALRLILGAEEFIADTVEDARQYSSLHGLSIERMTLPPEPIAVLMRSIRSSDDDRSKARKALTSPHFEHLLHKRTAGQS